MYDSIMITSRFAARKTDSPSMTITLNLNLSQSESLEENVPFKVNAEGVNKGGTKCWNK